MKSEIVNTAVSAATIYITCVCPYVTYSKISVSFVKLKIWKHKSLKIKQATKPETYIAAVDTILRLLYYAVWSILKYSVKQARYTVINISPAFYCYATYLSAI